MTGTATRVLPLVAAVSSLGGRPGGSGMNELPASGAGEMTLNPAPCLEKTSASLSTRRFPTINGYWQSVGNEGN